MSSREFWAAEAAKMRDTSALFDMSHLAPDYKNKRSPQPSAKENVLHILALRDADMNAVNGAIRILEGTDGLFSLAGLNIKIIKESNPNTFDDNVVVNNRTHAVAVIGGDKPEIAKFLKNHLKAITSDSYKDHIQRESMGGYLHFENPATINPETTDGSGFGGWSYVSAVTTKTNEGSDRKAALKRFGVNNVNDFVALCILHGLGHLSPYGRNGGNGIGIVYDQHMGHIFDSFMADGNDLALVMADLKGNLKDLISYTKKNKPDVIDNMKLRFPN